MTNFYQATNDAVGTLGAGYSPGAGSLILAAGAGASFPTPTATNPIRIVVMVAAKAYNPTTLTPADFRFFRATGKTGDTLTGIGAIEGSVDDRAFAVGDAVAMTATAGTLSDIHAAINGLETTIAALDASAISTGTLPIARGGTGQATAAAAFDALSPNTAKGDVTIRGATGNARLAAGTDGQILTTDSTQALGVKWATPAPGMAIGSTVTGGTANRVLHVGAGGVLAQDAGLSYDPATDTLTILGAADGRRVILQAAPTGQTQPLFEAKDATGTAQTVIGAGGLLTVPSGSSVAGIFASNLSLSRPGNGGSITWDIASQDGRVPLILQSNSSTGTNTVTVLVTCSHVAENILTVRGLASHTGDLQRWQDNSSNNLLRVDKAGRLVSAAGTPGIAAGTGAGTGPTVSVAGSDQAGTINVTTGTTPTAAATVVTITFATAYGVAPKAVLLTPANAAAAALAVAAKPYEDSSVRAAGSFVLKANGTALTASTAYKWNYFVL